ncbi:LANO_0H18360g1_1 [Lachancea nothofagi CBS 11611]|uniref:Transcription factor MBP1 n=1 Tax=Lachancea nothofagi CBS 11611 TaxID=1266666 RepID=A0A1G4KN77_9SACH|nr:LANO_0H18360g1_1 [Lachancea nothofagi CBS 11611]
MSTDQIYSAKYSGVDVYEFIHPTGSIMKRKIDDWVNATHILKAAKFAKAKRTRILEKEVINDTHEKVQGGFGKYQGTWVPLTIARNLAGKFEVLDELRPLFDYTHVEGSESPPRAPKHHHASRVDSTRKRATKTTSSTHATRSKASDTPSGSTTPTAPKKRGRPPSSKNKKQAASNLERSQSDMVFPRPAIPVSTISSKKLPSLQSPLQRTISLDPVIMRESGVTPQHFKELDIEDGLSSDIEPPAAAKVEMGSSSSSSLPTSPSGLSDDNTFDQRAIAGSAGHDELGSATSPISTMIPRFTNQSFSRTSDINSKVNEYLSKLVEYFVSNEMHSEESVPSELLCPPQNSAPYIDAWIDHEHHTAFHWACAMGNLAIVEALYNAGASTNAVNLQGENPLIRCSIFHNSFTRRTYPRIFQILHDTVFDVDSKLQTVIHHIVKRKSTTPSAVFYLDVLLSKLKDFSPQYRIENLLNSQDQSGDTAVHIAALSGDRDFFECLIQHGGLSTMKNSKGVTATELMNQRMPSSQPSSATNGKFKQNLTPSSPSEFLMYPSQTATRLSRGIPEVVNIMKEMADSYNRLHQARDSDVSNLEKTLKSMAKTISTVEYKTMEALEVDAPYSDVEELLSIRSNEAKELQLQLAHCKKEMYVRLERRQAKQLAILVQDQESEISKYSEEDRKSNRNEQVKLALRLSQLQLQRRAKLSQTMQIIGDNSKIYKYRKMISQGTEMDINEVDSCLDVILQSLSKSQ